MFKLLVFIIKLGNWLDRQFWRRVGECCLRLRLSRVLFMTDKDIFSCRAPAHVWRAIEGDGDNDEDDDDDCD